MDRALDGGPDASTGKGHFTRDIIRHLLDNGRVQS